MKTLLISKTGNGIPILYRLFKEGHECKAFIKNIACRRKLKGIITKVNSIGDGLMDDPDLIIFDSTGMGSFADKLKSEGRNVFGGSLFADKLYLDTEFSDKKLKEFGFKISDENRKFTFVVGMRFKDGVPRVPNCFIISTDTFYPMGFGKRLDGMATLAFNNEFPEIDIECYRIVPYAEKHKFTGVVYIKFDDQLRLVDIYPVVNPDYACSHFVLQSWFNDENVAQAVSGTLRLTLCPYPFDDYRYADFVYDKTRGQKIEGIMGNFLPNDLMYDGGCWVTTGSDGVLGDIYATGQSINEVFMSISDTFTKIQCPELAVRVDFIDYFNGFMSTLKDNGWDLSKFDTAKKTLFNKKDKDDTLFLSYCNAIKNGDKKLIREIRENLANKGKSIVDLAEAIG
jgi:hypothetical protein